ncbi:MAG: TadE/TadG family type IV pilus assembly protein [Acidimicrobiales bacterium]
MELVVLAPLFLIIIGLIVSMGCLGLAKSRVEDAAGAGGAGGGGGALPRGGPSPPLPTWPQRGWLVSRRG